MPRIDVAAQLRRPLRLGLAAAILLPAVTACGANSSSSTSSTGGAAAATTAAFTCPDGGLKMGVEPYDDQASVAPIYNALGDKLTAALGCKVSLTFSTNYTAEIEAMKNGKLDIGEFGPLGYVLANKVANAQAIVGFADKNNQPVTYTASIVTYAGSGITDLKSVKGHTFAYSDPASTSGFLMPALALHQAGLDPKADIKAKYAGSHTASFEAIKNKQVDAGELNSDTITTQTKKGQYSADKFPVLWQSDPLPNDPITVRGDLPDATKAAVTDAFLKLDLSDVADPNAILVGVHFKPTTDATYQVIRDAIAASGTDLSTLVK